MCHSKHTVIKCGVHICTIFQSVHFKRSEFACIYCKLYIYFTVNFKMAFALLIYMCVCVYASSTCEKK